jgi:molybdate transport system substrate-binding protein
MRNTPRQLVALALAAALALVASGCGNSDSDSAVPRKRTLTVLAASSLTGTFTDLASQFEAAHDGVKVKLVFGSSATLAQQTIEHAPGDVLATADQKTMDDAVTGGGVEGEPSQFATNVVVVAVPKGNPAHITAFADLERSGVDYLTCVPTAPCGAAAEALLAKAGISHKPVSQEVDVKSVLAKVEADEADAGLVYQTDVTASGGKVTGIEVPGAAASPNTYWMAVTAKAHEASDAGDLAVQWIEFLTSSEGQAVLKAAGFGTVG